MTDEEKKAIEFVKSELQDEKKVRNDYQSLTGLYGNLEIEIILNLIEKQSKEIEEINYIKRSFDYCVEQEKKKLEDKIKAKIEELDKIINTGGIDFNTKSYARCKKIVLQSLLEKE